ncbi:proline racemase family protein [Aquamicrobium sp.]|uniref:proline racemase family protein n=1 Tax=Aquamicrobium sp. TaxID=1872579 RepID=UPI00349EE379|nr:proline racemase family protein [Aquamicrobium sp.]
MAFDVPREGAMPVIWDQSSSVLSQGDILHAGRQGREQDVSVEIPGFGAARVDVAYGGNFSAILEVVRLRRSLPVSALRELTDLGLATVEAVRNTVAIAHPNETEPAMLKAAILAEAGTASRPARNIMVKEPGYFDRSPCGTGTSARMALEHRRGNLGLGEPYRHESILGTVFEGRLVTEADVGGIPAVIPQITGRAWITGACEFALDPGDPFPAGFKF